MPNYPGHDELINLLARSVRREILSDLEPMIRRIADAASEMEAALSGRGRGSRAGGRQPLATPRLGTRRRGRRSKNAPRGALKAAVMEILHKSNKPMRLSVIVNSVMKTPVFRGRNPKSVYNKINADLNKNPKVRRVDKGVYGLKK